MQNVNVNSMTQLSNILEKNPSLLEKSGSFIFGGTTYKIVWNDISSSIRTERQSNGFIKDFFNAIKDIFIFGMQQSLITALFVADKLTSGQQDEYVNKTVQDIYGKHLNEKTQKNQSNTGNAQKRDSSPVEKTTQVVMNEIQGVLYVDGNKADGLIEIKKRKTSPLILQYQNTNINPGKNFYVKQGATGDCYLLSVFNGAFSLQEANEKINRIVNIKFDQGNEKIASIKINLEHNRQVFTAIQKERIKNEFLGKGYIVNFSDSGGISIEVKNDKLEKIMARVDGKEAITNSIVVNLMEHVFSNFLQVLQDKDLKESMLYHNDPDRGHGLVELCNLLGLDVGEMISSETENFVSIANYLENKNAFIYVGMEFGAIDKSGQKHSSHALIIKGFDPKTGFFTLSNPWDNNKIETYHVADLQKRKARFNIVTDPNINTKYYSDGKPLTGLGKDSKLYKEGCAFNGIDDGKFYIDGKLAEGLQKNGRYYKNGLLVTGDLDGKYFKDGLLAQGIADDKFYVDGEVDSTYRVEKNPLKRKIVFVGEPESKQPALKYEYTLYKNNIPVSGVQSDGKLYKDGKIEKQNKLFNGKMYSEGIVANGLIEDKLYINGELYESSKIEIISEKDKLGIKNNELYYLGRKWKPIQVKQ